jgi:hypothetical protein
MALRKQAFLLLSSITLQDRRQFLLGEVDAEVEKVARNDGDVERVQLLFNDAPWVLVGPDEQLPRELLTILL